MGNRLIGTSLAASKTNIKAKNAHAAIDALVMLVHGVEDLFSAAAKADLKTDGGAAEDLDGPDEVFDFLWGAGVEIGIGLLGVADVPV